ncbi:hypothetical protein AVEN_204533-1 [Araneus ventricosus]|uniref:Uncharacterized protein n=1 Tax=Araneus ventricosus TaxID=182803 RepID=A0A4Y2HQT3_ARAVE|nr:hypothetical protein AVEN_204533-1 [Araneus ventricosus]
MVANRGEANSKTVIPLVILEVPKAIRRHHPLVQSGTQIIEIGWVFGGKKNCKYIKEVTKKRGGKKKNVTKMEGNIKCLIFVNGFIACLLCK